jgi:branched-chain amino acid transport system substrate-binding protein
MEPWAMRIDSRRRSAVGRARAVLLSLIFLAAASAMPASAQGDTIYIPNFSFRTGPFAAAGIPLMNGQRDYITLINARDGGLNGIRLLYEECEAGFNAEKGVECYEKTKTNAVIVQPWSGDMARDILAKANTDKIPVFGLSIRLYLTGMAPPSF